MEDKVITTSLTPFNNNAWLIVWEEMGQMTLPPRDPPGLYSGENILNADLSSLVLERAGGRDFLCNHAYRLLAFVRW